MKRILVWGSALLLIAMAAQAQMGKSGGVEQAITSMEQQWAAGAKAANPDSVAPLLADNFVNMDSDGTMHNKAETLARLKGAKWEINEVSNIKVATFGNTAIASGAWQGKGTDSAGKPVDEHEQWVDTWMKMPGGKWQCIASASAPAKV
jgi:ketosteroid isomerase-like protein